jgi:hypothetical protein
MYNLSRDGAAGELTLLSFSERFGLSPLFLALLAANAAL